MEKTGCISCGICTKNCEFLKKYNLDFSKEEELSVLSYHCFLCGKCTELCPQGIDGRGFILEQRRKQVKQEGKAAGYGMLQLEKGNYIFKNYRGGHKKSVLFPGCNFPAFFPETTRKLMGILDGYGIGTVFDCCGKPIAELGLAEKEDRIIERLNKGLREKGIEEVIMVCPNCYSYLNGKLDVKIVNIYEKLEELHVGSKIKYEKVHLFFPCPDRKPKKWMPSMKAFLPEQVEYIEGIQCCGLGGCAMKKEPRIAAGFSERIKETVPDRIFTYCGSCAGKFTRDGVGDAIHVLTEILETGERADVKHSATNRVKSKFLSISSSKE